MATKAARMETRIERAAERKGQSAERMFYSPGRVLATLYMVELRI